MKSLSMKCISAAALSVAILNAGCGASSPPSGLPAFGTAWPLSSGARGVSRGQIHYRVIELPTFGGTVSGFANMVNERGWVVGAANMTGDRNEHAFLWRDSRMKDLGTLGGQNSAAVGLNDRGDVAGPAETSNPDPLGEDFCNNGFGFGTHLTCRVVIWHQGKKIVLPTLGGNNSNGASVNNRGQAIGWAETTAHEPTCNAPQVLNFHAVLWDVDTRKIHDLAPLRGDPISIALGINEQGQVVGSSGICGDITISSGLHIVLWQNGTPRDLGNLGGSTDNVAFAINNRGQVTGTSGLPGNAAFHAFLWSDGLMTDLGTLPGDTFSIGYSVNDKGQLVGQSCDASFNCRAFIWQAGVMTDLNTLTPEGSPYLVNPSFINSHSEIVGQAFEQRSGSTPAFLAEPVDGSAAQPVRSAPRVALPENVRRITQHGNFGRL